MRLSTCPFLLTLLGLVSAQFESNATDFNSTQFNSTQFNSTQFNNTNVTFDDVRDKLPKVYSGQEGEGAPKYFKTLPHLSALIQTYLSIMADLGAETWIMHGSLLAWWWNQKIFPWDNDLDVQISEPVIHFLADYYNMTEHHFDIADVEGGRTYLLEINPNYVIRSKSDKANVIDGRWIDTSSGLFIDITAVRADDARRENGEPGALMCKDRHNFDESEIWPLRNSYFEDVPAKIPYAYTKLLQDEYGSKALSTTTYQGNSLAIMSLPPQLPPTADYGTTPSAASLPHGDGHDGPPPPAPRGHISHDSLALRSCITCRRRKVRCDKRNPCSNCVKAGIECMFPPPGRAPRKTKRPPAENAELLSRLRQLESIVEAAITSSNTQATPSPPQQRSDRSSGEPPAQPNADTCPRLLSRDQPTPLEHEFGRLVIEDNRSRYIEELQDILDPSSSSDDDGSSPGSSSSYSAARDGMLFGFYSIAHSLQSFHPPPENVKPLLPVVYGPTAQQLFTQAARTPDALDKNNEPLVLAMYFASIVSMSNEQCMARLGEARDTLVARYRFAVEQALSKGGLLNTQSLTLMQAATIFLNAVRRDDDTKFVWSMTALILRLAQGLGLHRDGNNFGLRPFDAEMRRRLWWHVVLLDLRSSEDHGTDVQIHDRMFDTRLPLNVNDNDISPDMEERPKPRAGFTDMSFFLIRCDICYALRRVAYTCPNTSAAVGGPTPENCGNVVQTVNRHIEEQYLKHCDMADPIQWVSATVARLVLTKMWLVIHHPITSSEHGPQVTNESRESLFLTSIEVTEFARLIKEDENTKKWSWMFDTHMQWHAIAMVLSELCVRPLSPLTDRAWLAVTTVYDDWLQTAKRRKGMLWRPLAQLMKRAGALRAKQLAELQGHVESQQAAAESTTLASAESNRPSIGSSFSAHFPEHSRLVASAPAMDWDPSQSPLGFDISQGPVNVLNQFFPEGNWLATPEPQNSNPPQALSNMNIPIAVPNEPTAGIPEVPPNSDVYHQEWDQVLRDFQLDMQEMQAHSMGNITGWIA
ncbi:putative C6 transcription factor [Aspergillus lucknowensis]|uniref:LicD family-domain-containing protein n=1 Tax=Aspergillus lucknowensis TaxID=176173 RepID=A0ABR4M3A0_9EURO